MLAVKTTKMVVMMIMINDDVVFAVDNGDSEDVGSKRSKISFSNGIEQ